MPWEALSSRILFSEFPPFLVRNDSHFLRLGGKKFEPVVGKVFSIQGLPSNCNCRLLSGSEPCSLHPPNHESVIPTASYTLQRVEWLGRAKVTETCS
jgi:hypothetical protein